MGGGARSKRTYRKGRDRKLSRAGVVEGSIPTARRMPVSVLWSFDSLQQESHSVNHIRGSYTKVLSLCHTHTQGSKYVFNLSKLFFPQTVKGEERGGEERTEKPKTKPIF